MELSPRAETVGHTHVDDHVEGMYARVRGAGWVVMDDGTCPSIQADSSQ